MAASEIGRDPRIADESADVVIEGREVLARGFRPYERVRARQAGGEVETRDVLRAGAAVAVLPIDLAREEVVLIRQFRLPAQLANGKGDLVEIVAGHVEANEAHRDTARRECIEEIGVAPQALIELFTYLTSPGLTDEEITLFLGIVDAARAALAEGDEREASALLRVPIDAALSALAAGTVRNGPARRRAAMARAQSPSPRRHRARRHNPAVASYDVMQSKERQTRSLPSPLWGGSPAEAQRRRAGWGWCGVARTSPHNYDPHPKPLPTRGRGHTECAAWSCLERKRLHTKCLPSSSPLPASIRSRGRRACARSRPSATSGCGRTTSAMPMTSLTPAPGARRADCSPACRSSRRSSRSAPASIIFSPIPICPTCPSCASSIPISPCA